MMTYFWKEEKRIKNNKRMFQKNVKLTIEREKKTERLRLKEKDLFKKREQG